MCDETIFELIKEILFELYLHSGIFSALPVFDFLSLEFSRSLLIEVIYLEVKFNDYFSFCKLFIKSIFCYFFCF